MTAIIRFVKNDMTYIAGERGNSDMNSTLPSISPKIFNIGPYAYGYAGLTGLGQMIGHTFPFTYPSDNTDIYKYLVSTLVPLLRKYVQKQGIDKDKEEDATEIILGYKGRLFELSTYDFQCVEYSITSIGSGKDFCLGAYHAIQDYEDPIYIARTCVEAANRFSTTCGGKIDIIYS